ncbi:MAG: glutamate--tRNA ligase family protein [Candidatus Hodgkinia cicadicola]
MVHLVTQKESHVFIELFENVVNSIRVRFAPSPSGSLHLGNLLIGKFNSLFALKRGGAMVLRLENTDFVNSESHYLTAIELTLNEFKIKSNESPMLLSYFGPYCQSERNHMYKFYGNILKSLGRSFICNCSFRRIEALKRVNLALGDVAVYDGKCLKRSVKYGKLRLTVPRYGYISSGKKVTRWAHVDMQTLLTKTKPSFHLASVVDDHLMRISHVIRGRDWLNEASKHTLIYLYLGFDVPKFLYLPTVCTPIGGKLSKRNSPLGLNGLIDVGFSSEAIDLYITSLIKMNTSEGLTLKSSRLIINQGALIKFNKQVLREANFDNNELLTRKLTCVNVKRIVNICAQKATTTSDVHRLLRFMFYTKPRKWCCMLPSLQYVLLGLALTKYKQMKSWDVPSLETLHRRMALKLNISMRTFSIILSNAILNDRDSISLYDALITLGRETAFVRIMLYMRRR